MAWRWRAKRRRPRVEPRWAEFFGMAVPRVAVPLCLSARAALLLLLGCAAAALSFAQSESPLGYDPYVTFAGNFDVGYHKTQFFEPDHHTVVGQWDTRVEVWLPPFRKRFSWGPYVRGAGIAASKSEAWENGWLAGPGVGLQVYPFSLPALRNSSNALAKILGPSRLYGEYNRLDYWGPANTWRPRKQTRIGAEHWRSLHVNDVSSVWWAETWNGLWWQSSNEFSPTYRSLIFANAVRSGIRAPGGRPLSAVTPYVALESSLTKNKSYYWENRLLVGGGVRFAPPLRGRLQDITRVNRFAVYAEYLRVGAYYRQTAPSAIPNYEVRIGVTFSTGLWYQ
jgi:hypothetical protein